VRTRNGNIFIGYTYTNNITDRNETRNYYDLSRDARIYQTQYQRFSNTSKETDSIGPFIWYYSYTYDAREAYLETKVTGTSNKSGFTPATTSSVYDGWGRRVAVQDGQERLFAYDATGNILQRIDNGATNFKTTRYALVSGQQVAASNSGYVDAISNLTAYRNSEAGSSNVTVMAGDTLRSIAQRVYGNDSLWYVLASANALTGGETLTAGTTLKVPEVQVSKNDATTFKPYNPAEVIGSTSPSLDYVPPPPKKSCNVLSVILTIIVVVIVAVVTVYTAGAAAPLLGASVSAATAAGGTMAVGAAVLGGAAGFTWAAIGVAAIAGAVGSAAGQLASMAFDLTDKFDWGAVAVGALTSVASMGVGSAVSGGRAGAAAAEAAAEAAKKAGTAASAFKFGANWAKGAAQAVGGNLANYGANWLVNRIDPSRDRSNEKFSWANLAASAVSGAITAELGAWLGSDKGMPKWFANAGALKNSYVQMVLSGTVSGFVGSATQHHVARLLGEKGDADYAKMLVDAFGNGLAEAAKKAVTDLSDGKLVRELKRDQEFQQLSAEQQQLALKIARSDGVNFDPAREGTLDAIVNAARASSSDDVEVRLAAIEGVLNVSGLEPEQVQQIMEMQRKVLGPVDRSKYFTKNQSEPAGQSDVNQRPPETRVTGADGIRIVSEADYVEVSDYDHMGAERVRDEATGRVFIGYHKSKIVQLEPIVIYPGVGSVLGETVDSLLINVGEVAMDVADTIERHPWLSFGLTLIDVAAGPAMFVVREAFNASPAGQWLSGKFEELSQWVAGKFVDAGYTTREAAAATAGGVIIGGLIIGGAKAALKRWTGLSGKINNFIAGKKRDHDTERANARNNNLRTHTFNNLDDFNAAANSAMPNSRYQYGRYTWTTDANGRVAQVEGELTLNPHGRVGQSLQTQIGNEGMDSDVGFHLIGDQFDGPINRLNVVQGNGKPVNGMRNLNTGAYAQLERMWRQELQAGNTVNVRINTSYNSTGVRPDSFTVWYQIGNNRPRTATLLNQAGQ
jgi:LysM repeat protein